MMQSGEWWGMSVIVWVRMKEKLRLEGGGFALCTLNSYAAPSPYVRVGLVGWLRVSESFALTPSYYHPD